MIHIVRDDEEYYINKEKIIYFYGSQDFTTLYQISVRLYFSLLLMLFV